MIVLCRRHLRILWLYVFCRNKDVTRMLKESASKDGHMTPQFYQVVFLQDLSNHLRRRLQEWGMAISPTQTGYDVVVKPSQHPDPREMFVIGDRGDTVMSVKVHYPTGYEVMVFNRSGSRTGGSIFRGCYRYNEEVASCVSEVLERRIISDTR